MIVFDLESTGNYNEIWSGAAIASIAAMEYENPNNRFDMQCRVPINSTFNKISLKYTGYTKDELIDINRTKEEEVLKSYVEWQSNVENQTIIGLNPWVLDMPLLLFRLQKYNIKNQFAKYGVHMTMDLHTLVYEKILTGQISNDIYIDILENKLKKRNFSYKTNLATSVIYKLVGLPNEEEHKFPIEAVLRTAEAFSRLVYGEKYDDTFINYPIPSYLKKEVARSRH